jgi:hypothetical protein
VIGAGPGDLDPSFATTHREILAKPRGGGYWLWKPHLIYRTLLSLADGDQLTYADAGLFVLPGFAEVHAENATTLARTGKSLIALRMAYPERGFTKRDVFIRLGCDDSSYWDSGQFAANFLLIIRNQATLDFFREWLRWCEFNIEGSYLIDDSPNLLGVNFPEFSDHRHDQSIYSLLCKRNAELLHEVPLDFAAQCLYYFHTPNSRLDVYRLRDHHDLETLRRNPWLRFGQLSTKGKIKALARAILCPCRQGSSAS